LFQTAKIVRNNKTTKDLSAKDSDIIEINRLFPQMEDCSTIVIGCNHIDYSASRIAHAVEDCNAHLLNLNVTSTQHEGVDMVIELRVNCREVTTIARSLTRYGFSIIDFSSSNDASQETLRDRVNKLLHYLEI
jgi:hypothetical protein